jgi:hypothetical protein
MEPSPLNAAPYVQTRNGWTACFARDVPSRSYDRTRVEVEDELAPQHRGGVAARGGWTRSNLLIARVVQIERELPYTDGRTHAGLIITDGCRFSEQRGNKSKTFYGCERLSSQKAVKSRFTRLGQSQIPGEPRTSSTDDPLNLARHL